MRRVGIVIALWCAWCVASAPTAGAAPEDIPAARARFRVGVDYYDAGKYEEALRAFQEAHALSHSAALYFNMAACEEHMDHYQAAALLLRQYLIEEPNAEDKDKVNMRIAALNERDDRLHRSFEPPLSPAPVASSPPSEPPVVVAAPTVVAPPPKSTRRVKYTFIPLGLTVGAGLAAIGTGIYTVVHHGTLHDGCGTSIDGCTASEIDGLHRYAAATDAMIGVTAAAAIATVIVAVIELRRPKERALTKLRLDGAGLGGRF